MLEETLAAKRPTLADLEIELIGVARPVLQPKQPRSRRRKFLTQFGSGKKAFAFGARAG